MLDELDLLDRKILYELDLDSRKPASLIAKSVRSSKETVNFRIKRLIKRQIIKDFITTINTSNLNRYYYKIFYKFNKATPEIENKITSFISTYKKTAWFGSFEGPYDLAFLLLAQSVYDLEDFLREFRKLFGDYILEQEIHTLTEVHRFNLKFFHDSKKVLHTKYSKVMKESKIDKISYEIIKNLANNSRISILELAKKLNIDSSTVIYRINKLRKEEIISTHTLALDYEKLGMQHFQIDFKLKNHECIDKIIGYFSGHKNATFATVALGKYDLALEFVVKGNKELKEILDDLRSRFADEIIDHDTFLITKEHNLTWFPYQSDN